MPDELFGFTAEQIDRLRRALEYVEAESIPGPRQSGRRPKRSSRVVIGLLTNAVAATTAFTGTPKVGEINIYSFSSTGTESLSIAEKCYNFAPQSATTDRWTICERCAMSGKLIITTQFCS